MPPKRFALAVLVMAPLALAPFGVTGFAVASAQDEIQELPGPRGPPDGERGPKGPRTPRQERGTFLSPAGEPYRSEPGQPYPSAIWFAKADADHDGKLTRDEFKADFERFFRTLDTNHDGVLDSFEVQDYEHNVAPEILSVFERPAGPGADEAGPGGGRRRGGGGGPPGGGAPGNNSQDAKANAAAMRLQMQGARAFSLLPTSEPVAGADADLDGKVSLAEFKTAADRRFDLLDKKKLGYLMLADLPRTPDQISIEGKKPNPQAASGQTAPPAGPPPKP